MTQGAFLLWINECLPLCIIQFQVAFIDAAADCVEWHHGSMTVSQTIPTEGSMVTCIQQQFPRLAFTHWNFPWSLNPFSRHYELWMVKNLNSLQSCADKPCLWTDWQFSHKIWHKVVNHNPSLLVKTKPLEHAAFILNFDDLTCYQLNCLLWNIPEQCYL